MRYTQNTRKHVSWYTQNLCFAFLTYKWLRHTFSVLCLKLKYYFVYLWVIFFKKKTHKRLLQQKRENEISKNNLKCCCSKCWDIWKSCKILLKRKLIVLAVCILRVITLLPITSSRVPLPITQIDIFSLFTTIHTFELLLIFFSFIYYFNIFLVKYFNIFFGKVL